MITVPRLKCCREMFSSTESLKHVQFSDASLTNWLNYTIRIWNSSSWTNSLAASTYYGTYNEDNEQIHGLLRNIPHSSIPTKRLTESHATKCMPSLGGKVIGINHSIFKCFQQNWHGQEYWSFFYNFIQFSHDWQSSLVANIWTPEPTGSQQPPSKTLRQFGIYQLRPWFVQHVVYTSSVTYSLVITRLFLCPTVFSMVFILTSK